MKPTIDPEALALKQMLEQGKLPCPLQEEDARAARRCGLSLGYGLVADAKLPDGWLAVQTEGRFGRLYDEAGRVRAEFFLKVTDYENKAWLQMTSRYSVSHDFEVIDRLTGTVLYVAADLEAAWKWLDEHFPRWRDPSRYWDMNLPWWQRLMRALR